MQEPLKGELMSAMPWMEVGLPSYQLPTEYLPKINIIKKGYEKKLTLPATPTAKFSNMKKSSLRCNSDKGQKIQLLHCNNPGDFYIIKQSDLSKLDQMNREMKALVSTYLSKERYRTMQ